MRRVFAASVLVAALAGGCDLASILRFPTAPGSGTKAAEPLVGQVLAADGKPAAGVGIAAFGSLEVPPAIANNTSVTGLLGNAGAGLAGNAGAGLIGNAGSGLVGSNPYRRVASVTGTTDASGSFYFRPDQGGNYNFEATQSDASKAWKLKVPVASGATQSLTIKLAATGTIAGTVTPAGSGSEDVVVVVPGSIYWVFAGTDGKYEIKGVPAGKFELRVARAGFKAAAIPDAAHPDPILVKAGETTKVDLELQAQ